MKQFLVVLFISLCLMGCRVGELTEQEKQKVVVLKNEVTQITKSIEAGEVELKKYSSGFLPTLIQMRTEQEKLTRSLLQQQIAAIESGAKTSITVSQSQPDDSIITKIKSEIADISSQIAEKTTESNQYMGGLIKVTLEATIAQLEFTKAALQHKLLTAQYGLALSLPVVAEKVQVPSASGQVTVAPIDSSAALSAPEFPKQENDTPVPIVDDGPKDFRNVRWGMSKAEVKAREAQKVAFEDNESLGYSVKIGVYEMHLFYMFLDDKLHRGVYLLNENFSNKNNYVDAYDTLVTNLKEKYGKPNSEKTVWSDDLYKNDYKSRGMAYSMGRVRTFAEWKKEGTTILATIDGNNFDIVVRIIYISDDLDKKFEERRKQKTNSAL